MTYNQKIPPFKWFILENFPYIEEDFDALTNWQLFCKLGKEMNKIIEKTNLTGEQVEQLTTAFNELKAYIDDYFENLDVQEEVNTKLDEMAIDGTLERIINQEIFGELNTKVEELEKSKTTNKLFLGTFFNETTETINFCTSKDGINFSDILTDINISGRDPHIYYNSTNKTFYLSMTGSGDSWDFTCYTSQDLINWSIHYVSLGILDGIRWAPELFEDENGDVYAIITSGTEELKSLSIAKCNNLENLTFNSRTELTLSQTNIIDGSIFYDEDNELYYLTCKNETTSKQLIYSSTNLAGWSLVNSDILKTNEPCEGGFILKTNDKYTFYGDTWQSFGYYAMAQTEDLSNFNAIERPNSLIGKRHGFITLIKDQEAVSLITQLESYQLMTNVNKTETRQFDLNGTIDNLIVYPNFIYRITGNTTIGKIINAYNLNEMNFYFATNVGATLTINKVINSEYQEKTINLTIYNTTMENEKLNKITLIGDPVVDKNPISIPIDSDTYIVKNSTEWNVVIYKFERFKDHIHIDGDVTKLSNGSSELAFAITNYLPTNNVFSITNNGKRVWLQPNGNCQFTFEVGQTEFFSFDYLCK